MTPEQAISKMIPPGQVRPKKSTRGVIQIHVTRACDLSCFNCTQGSNLKGPYHYMPPDLFEQAVLSLKDYWGIVGVFGGNPALHPDFEELCAILRKHIPKHRCGLWCNNPINESKAAAMRQTFNPRVSNLNVHLSETAYNRFKQWWAESRPFGLTEDSRHSPVYGSVHDLDDVTEEEMWDKIANCDINQRWSAGIGLFRGELRAWFCEIAMGQSILMQDRPDYPDTGVLVAPGWWKGGMQDFAGQVRQHCPNCLVPMRGYGALARAADNEAVETATDYYRDVYVPKRTGRQVEFVELKSDLESKNLSFVEYIAGAKK